MPHPDPKLGGSERDRRGHAGNANEASGAGTKDKSQSRPAAQAQERKTDDASQAPESGEKPEVMPPQGSPGR